MPTAAICWPCQRVKVALLVAHGAGTYTLTRHQRDTLAPRADETCSNQPYLPPASDLNLYLKQRVADSSSLITAEINIPGTLQDLSSRGEQQHPQACNSLPARATHGRWREACVAATFLAAVWSFAGQEW